MARFYTVALRHQAESQFGARQATEVAQRAAGAAKRNVLATRLDLHPAYSHIAEHFRAQPGKPSHGIFLPEYCQPQTLSKLIVRTVDAPGTEPMLSQSADGNWAAVLQTWFGANHPIGYSGQGPNLISLCFLCVVVELNGDLVTAYPVDCYRMTGAQVGA